MHIPQAHLAAGLMATSGLRRPHGQHPLDIAPFATPALIEPLIKIDDLFRCATDLQGIAYSTPGRNRLMGSEGHNLTVDYIVFELEKTGYFQVRRQSFDTLVQTKGDAFMSVGGIDQTANMMSYSPAGKVEESIVVVSNLGCNESDFPAEVKGKIALILRGDCPFGTKSINAAKAGAAAAVIYNTQAGPLSGTLGIPDPKTPFVATISITDKAGLNIKSKIEGGADVKAIVDVQSVIEVVTTENVIAETILGDKDNALSIGAHTDSVQAGPGINDNGSGTCGLLTIAKALSNFKVKNSVKFNFWSGEESGLLGSTHYVKTASKRDLAPVRLYLNFDMIASPNYVYGVYDGDGSTFNKTGPAGSAEAEHFFEDWFAEKGLPTVPSNFDGRSDYGPFLEVGIASGGLFTGAEELKTDQEALLFGGEAGIALDANYHGVGDTLDNLNLEAFEVNAKAISAAVATYSDSFSSLNQMDRVQKVGPYARSLARREADDQDIARTQLRERSAEWVGQKSHTDHE